MFLWLDRLFIPFFTYNYLQEVRHGNTKTRFPSVHSLSCPYHPSHTPSHTKLATDMRTGDSHDIVTELVD